MNEPIEIADVSVVMPCYQCADTVGRAIESIAAQTMRPREVICVDDKSPDPDTLETLKSLQEKFGADWLICMSLEENAGPSTARNAGWERAQSKYIAFLDSDDSWHPRKIEMQFQFMKADSDLAITATQKYILKESKGRPEISPQPQWRPVSKNMQLISNRFPTSSVMLKRDLPYRFHPDLRRAEDYLLWLQIILSDHRGSTLPEPLCFAYKPFYGVSGLNADIAAMNRAISTVFRILYDEKRINAWTYFWALGFAKFKYLVRKVRVLFLKRV
jgi:glycosyltransferase involved in cell wall biosynthesis